jgi:hypothetical protein
MEVLDDGLEQADCLPAEAGDQTLLMRGNAFSSSGRAEKLVDDSCRIIGFLIPKTIHHLSCVSCVQGGCPSTQQDYFEGVKVYVADWLTDFEVNPPPHGLMHAQPRLSAPGNQSALDALQHCLAVATPARPSLMSIEKKQTCTVAKHRNALAIIGGA